ncbi:MAG: Type II secretion system protein E [Phycisphaerae bacterium]|nr:Type II secretion system protein E [Phycisphaerae bacterium]
MANRRKSASDKSKSGSSKSKSLSRKAKGKLPGGPAPMGGLSDLPAGPGGQGPLSIDEAAAMLKVSRPTFYRWVREGRVKGHKVGKQWRFAREDLDRFLHGQSPRVDLPVSIKPLLDRLAEASRAARAPWSPEAEGDTVARAAHLMVIAGTAMHASDMSIEPQVNAAGGNIALVRFRVDGLLRTAAEFDLKLLPAVIEQFKRMAACDVHENKRPQDGRILIELGREKKRMDLRVCFVPALFGESMTVRFLDPDQVVLKLDRMKFQPEDRARIDEALTQPSGLIVVTGPTGCGKTTVIYSCLMELVSPAIKVMSIEDPVEYMLPGVVQMPVRPQFDVTFERAMRAMLRSAPDVIFVGEIRNRDTLMICLQAALTGHLVITTLHTDDAASALRRMIDIGGDPFIVADAVKLIVAQRLVRCLLPEKSAPMASPELLGLAEKFARAGGLKWDTMDKAFREPAARGVEQHAAYRGRMLIAETLKMSPAIGRALRENATADQLRATAVSEGMVTWAADGVRQAAAGRTTLTEVMRLVGNK